METNESTSRGGDVSMRDIVGAFRALIGRLRSLTSHATMSDRHSGIIENVADEFDAIASRLAQQGGTKPAVFGDIKPGEWPAIKFHDGQLLAFQSVDARENRAANAPDPDAVRACFVTVCEAPTPTADRVSVPREATEAMLNAMEDAMDNHDKELPSLRNGGEWKSRQTAIYAAAIAAAPAPAGESRAVVLPDAWQPIETAPKDGSKVLIAWEANPEHEPGGNVCVGWYEKQTCNYPLSPWRVDRFGLSGRVRCGPTHWQPLPPPPTTGDAREGQGDG